MEDIKVSVLCIAYNHEKYIRQALDSVLCQRTNFKFEIIVHDDASTDETKKIIEQYERLYPDIIRAIYQKENQYSKGIPIVVNYLYPIVRGKYIAYLECDDYWISETKLQQQVDFLEEHEEYIGCVHKCNVVDQNDEILNIRTFAYYEDEGKYELKEFFKNELPGQFATLVHRNIVKEFPEEFYNSGIQGDLLLYLFLLTKGNIYRMKDIMSAYRFVSIKGGSSWSSRQLTQPTGYNNWTKLKKLERIYKQIYNKKISLKKRKCRAVLISIKDLRKRHKLIDFFHVFYLLLVQRGVCAEAINVIREKHKK